jgi:hypothetical protein
LRRFPDAEGMALILRIAKAVPREILPKGIIFFLLIQIGKNNSRSGRNPATAGWSAQTPVMCFCRLIKKLLSVLADAIRMTRFRINKGIKHWRSHTDVGKHILLIRLNILF